MFDTAPSQGGLALNQSGELARAGGEGARLIAAAEDLLLRAAREARCARAAATDTARETEVVEAERILEATACALKAARRFLNPEPLEKEP